MKNAPKVMKYMTPMPHTIGRTIPIKKAIEMMREGNFRHLPVQEEGKLVGILSDRDIKLAASFAGATELTAEDVMTPDPYAVAPDADLMRVVEEMAEHKYGCAVVRQENDRIVGIFTDNDALKALVDILRKNY